MKISTRQKHESQIIPGVTFTTRLITEPVRLALRNKVLKHTEMIEELTDQLRPLYEARRAKTATPEELKQIKSIEAQVESIEADHVDPEWIKAGLISTDLETDDVLVTPENCKELAPSLFYGEILTTIKSMGVLAAQESKN